MEANAGKSFQMQILFNIFPRISLHCKLVPVQYWEYEYGLFKSDPPVWRNDGNADSKQNEWDSYICLLEVADKYVP